MEMNAPTFTPSSWIDPRWPLEKKRAAYIERRRKLENMLAEWTMVYERKEAALVKFREEIPRIKGWLDQALDDLAHVGLVEAGRRKDS